MNDILTMLQEKEAEKTAARTLKKVQESNAFIVEGMMKRFGLKVNEELTTLVSQVAVRCGKAIALLAEELQKKTGEEIRGEHFVIKVGAEKRDCDAKTGFPLLFVSSTELEDGVRAERQRHEEKEKAAHQAAIQKEWVAKRVEWLRRLGIEPSETFRRFVRDIPPMRTSFDGSAARVNRIAKMRSGVERFGEPTDDIFAVAFDNNEGIKEVTIFVKEIDFRKDFAKKLERKGLSAKLAKRISDALPHDRWYNIFQDIRTGEEVLDYSREVAKRLHVREGEKVHDLLQGDLEVFTFEMQSDDGKTIHPCFIKVRPAEPSAMLVGNVVNLYLPK